MHEEKPIDHNPNQANEPWLLNPHGAYSGTIPLFSTLAALLQNKLDPPCPERCGALSEARRS